MRLCITGRALKGALLSGLVFPGLGQIYLKRQKRGKALFFVVSLCLAVLMTDAVQIARSIVSQIVLRREELHIHSVIRMASAELSHSGKMILKLSSLFIVFCWLFGIADALIIWGKNNKKRE